MKKLLALCFVCLSLYSSAQIENDFNIEEYYKVAEEKYIDITNADSTRILRYIVTDTVNHYVSVYKLIYQLYHWDDLVISPTIEYEGVTYTVTGISRIAFIGCTFFKSVFIPNTVTSIGDGAFARCIGDDNEGLREITVEEGNPNYTAEDGVLFNKDKTTLICCPARKAGEYTIPNTVTSIGIVAFNYCRDLASVTIPNTVTTIEGSAFCGCDGLTSIIIPNSVTSIADQAFTECSNLTSVSLSNAVTSIGKFTFEGCKNLTSITIPNTVKSIGYAAFRECSNLTSVTIGNSVASIGNEAFKGCTGLTTITFPNTVKSIGDYAFYNCSLAPITIPDSVISIGKYAFAGCDGRPSVFIPISVTTIGYAAFHCDNLSDIYCEAAEKPDGWDKRFWYSFSDYDDIGGVDYGIKHGIVWGYKEKETNNGENQGGEANNGENNSGSQNNENQGGETNNGEDNNGGQNNENQGGEANNGENNNGNQNNENQSGEENNNNNSPNNENQGNGINNGENNNNQNSENQNNNSGHRPDIPAIDPVSAIINQINNIHNIIHSVITDVEEEAVNEVNIYAYGNTIIVENADAEIFVYDAMGRLVCRNNEKLVRTELQINSTGVYIVKVGKVAKRVVVN